MSLIDHNLQNKLMKSAADAALKSISDSLMLEREEEIKGMVADYERELRKRFALHLTGTANEFYHVDIQRHEFRITVKHV